MVELDAKGVDATLAPFFTDQLVGALEGKGLVVVSDESMKTELKRMGIKQQCGVEECEVPLEKLIRTPYVIGGAITQTGNIRSFRVRLDRVSPRETILTVRRTLSATGDDEMLALAENVASEIGGCLKPGKPE